ncbi:formate dehydrogenase subunit gamma [Fodinicurvata halophila]|uniref:formate dehydrogenase subunit gamma n=1 Tax=Fodinicurvata halophila TaxID=1419723 RepID=UPI00363ACA72
MSFSRMALTVPAFAVMLMLAFAALGLTAPAAQAQSSEQTSASSQGPQGGAVPGESLGTTGSADQWRAIRDGLQGSVSIPDKKSAILIQSGGENWRSIRNGPLMTYGSWLLLGTIILLALFYLLRGRIRLEKGPSGIRIERFGALERSVHWMTAVSFILLALTGINVLWGRHVLLPVVGPEAFSVLTIGGKYVHNFVAFPFMLGVLLMFVLWVGQNIPNRHDLVWFAKGGGMFSKHSHPPARKFNGGQKIIFWAVALGGLSLSCPVLLSCFPLSSVFGRRPSPS